ncbi:saccharopine dehydrogenase NADP-binding domain-containing protein [bacterium]|jgi:short subunit dehydrogenase-like uncharacterized protein|nr:saccharopine dehydrogenase NADP-binding domain-containing protein [bacterium]
MSGDWLLYGAYGYTGELTVRIATEKGYRPILSGRDPVKLEEVARKYDLPFRVASLEDRSSIDKALEGVTLVLHTAGPFSHTYRPMSDACLRKKVHYLDITGEVAVFEALAARNEEARSAGVMLIPGVGFDVVPSDNLAAHLKSRLPDAHELTLGFQGLGRLSRGTATTMAEGMGRPGAIRKDGKIVPVPPGYKTREIDFGRGPTLAVTIPWGDVSTAFHSTGIPNIEVYTAMPAASLKSLRFSRYIGFLLRLGPVQNYIKGKIKSKKAGPDDAERERGASLLWGEVRNKKGETRSSRIRGPEGYTLTALTSLLIVERVLRGEATPGFQTPSRMFGKDLILEVPGTVREDIS